MAASWPPRARLLHIRDEIDQLARVVESLDEEAFSSSYLHRRTAEHAVLIISEAVRALPAEMLQRHPGPNWPAMRGIGNVLRHDTSPSNPPSCGMS